MIIAWFSYFPIEWLPDAPDEIARLPRQHPAPWQRVLLECLRDEKDVELHVLVLRKNIERSLTFERGGVTFHVVKTIGGLRAPSIYWYDTILIRKLFKEIRPDVVHAWGTENGAGLVASRLKYPAILTVQGLGRWMGSLMPLSRYERWAALFEHIALRRARLVTAESTFSSGYVREQFPAVEVRHIDVVPASLFHGVQRKPELKPVRLLYSGTLGPRKGGDIVLLALDQLLEEIEFQLVVIGGSDDAFVDRMKGITKEQLWRRIEFRQGLQSPDVADELSKAAIFVCATRADTGPMAVKEAAVAGVPVVASRIGGIPDYVYQGENGILFQSENVSELVVSLRAAVKHPLFGRGQVDPSCLSKIREYLSPERMKQRFLEAYRAVCRRPQANEVQANGHSR